MKNVIMKIAIPAITICLVLGLSQTALASGTFRTTAGVHVRSSASTSANSVTTVSEGSSVDVIEHDPAGWSRVQVGGKTGYIRSDFLKYSIGDTPASFRVTSGVHVRASASTSANSLTTVSAGSNVDVLEHNPAGWSKVQVGGTVGYIRSDFLKHAGTASSSSGSGEPSGQGNVIEQLRTLGDSINMRTEPTTSAKVVKQLGKDVVVDVLANESNGWSKVKHNGDTGYIRSDLLAPLSSSSQTGTQTLYTTGNVNLRSSPSVTPGTFVRTLSKGTAVEVIEKASDGWSKVKQGGTDGYIKSEFLTASAGGESQTRYTSGSDVRLRAKASTASSIIRTLARGTAVTVVADESNGWSSVIHNGTSGYIKSDLLSASQPSAEQVSAIMSVIEPKGANVRSGPGTSYNKLTALPLGSVVTVLANESGWSKVKVGSITGYIKSDLLGAGTHVELVTMAEISGTLPVRQNIRLVDVRTGISFNVQIFSKGKHADMDYSTREDLNAMFSTRNGVRSWSARPVWVYVGGRVYAAATHGMPHDVNFINNGASGHFCLHFKDTVTNSKSYQADLRRAVQEAYDKRPR